MPASADKASRFLGVRLTAEEVDALDRLRAERGLLSRSDAVRSLLRAPPPERPGAVELPVTRRAELEQLVEDGYFTSLASVVEYALEVALRELVASHDEGLAQLRRRARELRQRGERRHEAAREGRELLRR